MVYEGNKHVAFGNGTIQYPQNKNGSAGWELWAIILQRIVFDYKSFCMKHLFYLF
jgi:hypothetical protein